MPKKNKQLEQQIETFAGSTAGSVVIAVGIGVVAFPYAVEYIVKKTTEKGGEALVYAIGIIWQGMKGEAGKVKELLDAKAEWLAKQRAEREREVWHEANPDVTQEDIDVPAVSGDPYTEYLQRVGLPVSTVLVLFGDKAGLAVYQHSGEWDYYGTRQINGQHYYLVIPKGIKVYYKFSKDIWVADIDGVCPPKFKTTTKDADGFALPPGAIGCTKTITTNLVIDPTGVWP